MKWKEYLKKENSSFRLQYVSKETFQQLLIAEKNLFLTRKNFLAGYAPLKGEHFRSSGGLKVSDPQGMIPGSFIIEESRIIYDCWSEPFYRERDSFVYGATNKIYYTTLQLPEILAEELKRKRKFFLYLGEIQDQVELEEVTKEKLMSFALDKEESYQLQKKMYKRMYGK